MSSLIIKAGESLQGSNIRDCLGRVSDLLVSRGYAPITVVSGTRLLAWQEAIFRDRYVTAGNVRGRRIYDTVTWQGQVWYRISAAGRVAPPNPSAPHVRNVAADLGYPYNVYGAARNAMLQAIKDLGLAGILVNTGTGFGEVWHWEVMNGAGTIGGGGSSAGTVTKKILEDEGMQSVIVDGVHKYSIDKQFLSHAGSDAQSDITKSVFSATDELHKLSSAQMADLMDACGIPSNARDPKTGHVWNPQMSRYEGNGVWSRERQILTKLGVTD